MAQNDIQGKNRARLEKFRQEMGPEFFEKLRKDIREGLQKVDEEKREYMRMRSVARVENRHLFVRGKTR